MNPKLHHRIRIRDASYSMRKNKFLAIPVSRQRLSDLPGYAVREENPGDSSREKKI